MSEIKISEYFKECLDAASQHQRKADENYNACNLPTYAALEQRVRELERDWKEKCIEADTMRQHHKNAEASLREQEERNEKLAALVKEEWVSGAAWVYNTAAQGQWRDATKAVEARWPESSTAAKLAALSPNPSP